MVLLVLQAAGARRLGVNGGLGSGKILSERNAQHNSRALLLVIMVAVVEVVSGRPEPLGQFAVNEKLKSNP